MALQALPWLHKACLWVGIAMDIGAKAGLCMQLRRLAPPRPLDLVRLRPGLLRALLPRQPGVSTALQRPLPSKRSEMPFVGLGREE